MLVWCSLLLIFMYDSVYVYVIFKLLKVLYCHMQPEGNNAVDGEKEKDDGRSKSFKVNR